MVDLYWQVTAFPLPYYTVLLSWLRQSTPIFLTV